MKSYLTQLQSALPTTFFESEVTLAPMTTVKIGGPAEIFVQTKTTEELITVVSTAKRLSIPLTLLGWGANSLIADQGIRGLVVKNLAREITINQDQPPESLTTHSTPSATQPRWQADGTQGSFKYDFGDLDYDESGNPILVTLASGVPLPYAINFLLSQGITGLQWYARIPATIGGAVYNNIHGGTHFLSEVIESVTVILEDGTVADWPASALELGYDDSVFHRRAVVIVAVVLRLYQGDVALAKKVVQEWSTRKKVQPQNSLGCVFQNLSVAEQTKLGLPTNSVGYIIDKVLGRAGHRIGDVQISPSHAAFFENLGQATAHDYVTMIKLIKQEAQTTLGVVLKPEIFFLGFEPSELVGIME